MNGSFFFGTNILGFFDFLNQVQKPVYLLFFIFWDGQTEERKQEKAFFGKRFNKKLVFYYPSTRSPSAFVRRVPFLQFWVRAWCYGGRGHWLVRLSYRRGTALVIGHVAVWSGPLGRGEARAGGVRLWWLFGEFGGGIERGGGGNEGRNIMHQGDLERGERV